MRMNSVTGWYRWLSRMSAQYACVGVLLIGWEIQCRAIVPRLVVDSVLNLSAGTPHGMNEISYARTVRVVNEGNQSGNYFLSFSVPGGGVDSRRLSSGSSELAYQFYRTPTSSIPLRDFPDVRAGEVLIGRFGSGDVQHVLEFTVRMANQVWLPPGNYSDSFVLRLFSGTIDNCVEVESQLVSLQREISVSTDLSLVNNGGAFVAGTSIATLDFGLIDQEVTRSIECIVKSNVGYNMGFSSDSGGYLSHHNGFRIPYTLSVDGLVLPLASGGESLLNSGYSATVLSGRPHSLSIRLSPDDNQAAGDYSDNIRISIWAQ